MIRQAILVGAVLSAAGASATEQQFGDWTASREPDYAEAFVVNDSGSMVGMWCASDGKCFYYLWFDSSCTEHSETIGLVNADIGAVAAGFVCTEFVDRGKDKSLHVFADFEGARDTFTRAKEFGIAMPLEGGEFQVMRFSMSGSRRAMEAATAHVAKTGKPGGKRKLTDERR